MVVGLREIEGILVGVHGPTLPSNFFLFEVPIEFIKSTSGRCSCTNN